MPDVPLSAPSARVPESQEELERLIRQARCQHDKRTGGNDYIECPDCGLLWDYRRPPEGWRATAHAELITRLAALQAAAERKDGRHACANCAFRTDSIEELMEHVKYVTCEAAAERPQGEK